MAAFGQPGQPGPSYYTPTPFVSAPGRKRRADSPPEATAWSAPQFEAHHSKRRRPNLASGFATMSISPKPSSPTHFPRPEDTSSSDDEGLEPSKPPLERDVAVEVLNDRISPTSPGKRPRPLWHRNSSFSSTSPSEEDYESDATFRLPAERLARRHPVQPSSIEDPDQPASRQQTSPIVEAMESPLKRKHLSLGDEMGPMPPKRSRGMDMDDVSMDTESEHYASGPGWYEPEKDRVVVTALSSPEPFSRSPSPDPGPRSNYRYDEHRRLSQPGDKGFTISPSMLTHILGAQRDQFSVPSYPVPQERGLVLYRPLGIPPAPSVVQQWDQDENPGRFEAVDEDEELMSEPTVVGIPVEENSWGHGMESGFGHEPHEPQWDDDAMEIE